MKIKLLSKSFCGDVTSVRAEFALFEETATGCTIFSFLPALYPSSDHIKFATFFSLYCMFFIFAVCIISLSFDLLVSAPSLLTPPLFSIPLFYVIYARVALVAILLWQL